MAAWHDGNGLQAVGGNEQRLVPSPTMTGHLRGGSRYGFFFLMFQPIYFLCFFVFDQNVGLDILMLFLFFLSMKRDINICFDS